ncbi:MAG: hypothetical protein IKH86_07950 [Prevotella sp.]|nr:hypothetical protein [Prevotella sp.]
MLKKDILKRIVVNILLLLTTAMASGQVNVESSIDSMEIFIGEQVRMTVNVTMKHGQRLAMPVFKPTEQITPGVEVLSEGAADTAELDNDMVRVSKQYTLTSFDENLYYLPPVKVKVDGKEYSSKNLALKVLTVPVDTLHPNQFFPPKSVQDNPFLWSEWSGVFWLSVLVLILIMLAVYLRLRLRENKPIIASVKIIKRVLPHQKAMQQIEQIKADRLVSSENQKEYYTKLTDTLRKYIEERFGFNAMEMTSDEIIERLQQAEDRRMIDELRELFTTADLVKFAKYSTLINENDANLVNAIEFINTTKIENQPTEERIEPQLTEQDKRSIRSRITIKWVLWAIMLVGIAIVIYVFYQIFLLLG